MDWFHVDIILLIILCFLTVFMCAYGIYCVYRVLVSLQMQILLRPTRVLFSHKKAGQSREELRTVVAYQNPFSGDYCVHKSRGGARGYLNTTPSPDSGLSDEYEPLHQSALAHRSVEPDNQLCVDPEYRQNVETAHKQCQSVGPAAYRQSQSVESAYKQNVEQPYSHSAELAYRQSLDPQYQQQEDSVIPKYVHPAYFQRKETGMINVDIMPSRHREPVLTVDPPYRQRQKSTLMMSTEQTAVGVKLTSTRSLNTSQPLRLGWMTHLKSALRKQPHQPLKTSSMPSVEDNVLNKTWNWNYKEYQI